MDEQDIIERCRAGELDAYRQVYDRYGQPLLRTATRLLGSKWPPDRGLRA